MQNIFSEIILLLKYEAKKHRGFVVYILFRQMLR